jgi:hypothetical protein
MRLTNSHSKNYIVQEPDNQPWMDGMNRKSEQREMEADYSGGLSSP